MTTPSDRALEVARLEARLLMGDGARVTVLTGSHARGDAHPESDLDIRGVGEERPKALHRRDEFLVSTSLMTRQATDDAFRDPGEVGEFVPGWRDAIVLFDPDGVGKALKQRAHDWDWAQADSRERWIADQITSQAEEIHTLIGNIDQDQLTGAAAIRSQIVAGLAKLLSVHRQILYGSENELWDLVGRDMGDGFAALQATALGVRSAPLEEACKATFALFELASEETWPSLDERQRAVVGHARELCSERS